MTDRYTGEPSRLPDGQRSWMRTRTENTRIQQFGWKGYVERFCSQPIRIAISVTPAPPRPETKFPFPAFPDLPQISIAPPEPLAEPIGPIDEQQIPSQPNIVRGKMSILFGKLRKLIGN